MSLAFALMAAINGSTGSCATLAYGLYGTKPRRRRSGGSKDSHCSGAAAQAARDTGLKFLVEHNWPVPPTLPVEEKRPVLSARRGEIAMSVDRGGDS
jgi:hypothetical protein